MFQRLYPVALCLSLAACAAQDEAPVELETLAASGTLHPFTVFRPSTGEWLEPVGEFGITAHAWGQDGDIPVPGVWRGDIRQHDLAVYRPSTSEFFWRSRGWESWGQLPYGQPGDIPVPADYTGSGRMEPAVYRPETGQWFMQAFGNTQERVMPGLDLIAAPYACAPAPWQFASPSSPAVWSNGNFGVSPLGEGGARGFAYGQTGDIPVTGRWRGAVNEIAVIRQGENTFYTPDGGTRRVDVIPSAVDGVFAWDFDGDLVDALVLYVNNSFYIYGDGMNGWVTQWGLPDDLAVYNQARGNVADTGVLGVAFNVQSQTGEDICKILMRMYQEARAAGDFNWAEAIKRTQKAKACRRSRS